jgi:hypothetical protein
MMAEKEYIERETLERYIRKEFSHLAGLLNYIRMYCPAAEVVEVRHGEWKYNRGQAYGEPLFFCSLCIDGGSNSGHDNYCPNCGAKMDGKGEA